MSFDWREYLAVAEDLDAGRAPSASEEARARAAVSRAYYAVFCRARDYLIRLGEISHARADEPHLHSRVAQQLSRGFDGRRRDVAQRLRDMRAARNRCDYEGDVPDVIALKAATLTHARHAFAKLEALGA